LKAHVVAPRSRRYVVASTAAEGEQVETATVGVYELPKLVSAVIAAGARCLG
jgi:predicted RecA/RadA family phage recombinase